MGRQDVSEENEPSWREYVSRITYAGEEMPELMSHYDLVLDDELQKLLERGRSRWQLQGDLRCLADILYLSTRKNVFGNWVHWIRMYSEIEVFYGFAHPLWDGYFMPKGVKKDAIKSAASEYLDRPDLHKEEIDYLVMGMLVEAEVAATGFSLSQRLMGSVASRLGGDSFKRGMFFRGLFSRFWSFVLLATAVAIGAAMAQLDAVYVLLPALVWLYVQRGRKEKKTAALMLEDTLNELLNTHAELLASTAICWKRIGHLMKKSTDKGINWDNELWLLVEQRGGL